MSQEPPRPPDWHDGQRRWVPPPKKPGPLQNIWVLAVLVVLILGGATIAGIVLPEDNALGNWIRLMLPWMD